MTASTSAISVVTIVIITCTTIEIWMERRARGFRPMASMPLLMERVKAKKPINKAKIEIIPAMIYLMTWINCSGFWTLLKKAVFKADKKPKLERGVDNSAYSIRRETLTVPEVKFRPWNLSDWPGVG